jgi:hypothetical protein
MKKGIAVCIQVFLILLISSSYASATDWRFPFGLTYAGNFTKVVDLYKDNLEAEGYDVDTKFVLPVGLTFQPYVEFDFGLGIGAGFGPIMFITTNQDKDFFNVPINMNLRYSFIPKGDISPYVRGGISYNIASGDYRDKSKPGPFGAVGVEFSRKKPVGFGFEVGYDASTITFDDLNSNSTDATKDIKPIGFFASIFAIF